MATNPKSKKSTPVGERKFFKVSVFEDEYEGLGVEGNMSLSQACGIVRAQLGVSIPMRRGLSTSNAALASAIRTASPETRNEITRLLAEREGNEQDDSEDE